MFTKSKEYSCISGSDFLRVLKGYYNGIAFLRKASDIEDYFRDFFFLPTLKAVAQNVGK